MKVSDAVHHLIKMLTAAFQNHVVLQLVRRKKHSRCPTPTALSATSKSGLQEDKLEDSSHGVRFAWRNPTPEHTGSPNSSWRSPMLYSSSHDWRSSEQTGAESDASVKKFVMKRSSKGKASQRKLKSKQWQKSFGKTPLLSTISIQKKSKDEVRDGAQVPRRSVHLGRPHWKPRGFDRRGTHFARR